MSFSARARPFAWRLFLYASLVFVVLLVFASLPIRAARAEGRVVTFGARPAWVTPLGDASPSEASAPSGETPNGRHFRLYDHQVRASDGPDESYSRWVFTITNESGLQGSSELRIEVDPSYQTMRIHGVVIRREGAVLDRLQPSAIRIMDREASPERQVFDDRRVVVLFLSDLRVGDTVDYDYTIRGSDPTLQGHFVRTLELGGSEPLDRIHARVLAPESRAPRVAMNGPDSGDEAHRAHVETANGIVEQSWDLHGVRGYNADPQTPSWIAPAPWVLVSDFASWKELATWGTALFRARDEDDAKAKALREWVRETRKLGASHYDFVERAIRFVQDEVRYVAIEEGMGRRRPTDPGVVFERRYGDCKDKAALLVAMLRLVGRSAHVALVSTTHGHAIDDTWLPSPALFDHAIVRLDEDDGHASWIDPTIALQGGGIERFQYAPYGHALTLAAETEGLDTLEDEPSWQRSSRVVDRFTMPLPGTEEEARLDVERKYEGAVADAMRAAMRAQTLAEQGKELLALYEQDFPSIHEAAPVERFDDRKANVVRVVAHFSIPHAWQPMAGGHRRDFTARRIEVLLERPSIARSAPLAMPFPLRVQYVEALTLPFDIAIAPQTVEEESAGLKFHFDSSYAKRELTYTYDVTVKAPAIEVADLPQHIAALDRARPYLARAVTWRPVPPNGPNWIAIGVVALFGILFAAGAIKLHGYEPRASWMRGEPSPREFPTFGGWLYLLAIPLVLGPFVHLSFFVKDWSTLTTNYWHVLSTPGLTTYRPGLAPIVIGEAVLQVGRAVYTGLLAVLFFQRRRAFCFHYAVLWGSSVLASSIDIIAVGFASPELLNGEVLGAWIRIVISGGVWSWYLARSRRVATTFTVVLPRAAAHGPDAPEPAPLPVPFDLP